MAARVLKEPQASLVFFLELVTLLSNQDYIESSILIFFRLGQNRFYYFLL